MEIPLANYEITSNDDPTLEVITLTLFVAGCVRRCIDCQNPELQVVSDNNHKLISLEDIKKIINDCSILAKGVCFCGGDFLPLYKSQLYELALFCKMNGLKTIIYTGELFEDIDSDLKAVLDIIVDGPYDKSKQQSKFPASSNQRCWINGNMVNCDSLKINEGIKMDE